MKKSRTLTLLLAFALVLAACGGDGGSSDESGNGNNDQSQGSDDNGNGGDDGNGDNGNAGEVPSDSFDVPDLDPSDMPPAGQARVEVDGKTFTFEATDLESRLFTCEIRVDGISVNFQLEGHDLFLQGATQSDGSILASVTMTPDSEDNTYNSTNAGGRGGGVAVDGSHILFVGQFDSTPAGDPAGLVDVGQGSVAVTCP